jgi:tetratricopeptide (TPR) repeat protein
MKSRLRDFIIILVCAVPLASGILWLSTRRPRATVTEKAGLGDVVELARARKFETARERLADHLRDHPDDSRANLLMGELATSGTDPNPTLALEHLERVRAESPEKAAFVQFFMGKARYQAGRFDLAEAHWREALRLHPTVPEAGWALFDLLGLEARIDEAHTLGLQFHDIEPDPRDRVWILLELAMHDVEKSVPGSIVVLFRPLAAIVPDNLTVARTLGLALIRDSHAEEGIEILRQSLARHPDSPEAWDAWLTGLDDAGRPDEFAKEFARLPKPLASDIRFAKHAGLVAQGAQDWRTSAAAYGRALDASPSDGVVLYRLSRVIRLAGDSAESDRIEKRLKDYQTASLAIGKVVEEARAITRLGFESRPQLYQRLADLRERMGRIDDALAWHRLVLRDRSDDATSLAAVARLTRDRAERLPISLARPKSSTIESP